MTTARLLLATELLLVLYQITAPLKCYSCSFSFNELYDLDHRDAWCANESLVLFDTDETAKSCAPWEKYCVVRDVNRYGLRVAPSEAGQRFLMTAVNTINKAFTSVSRGCGERCSELCESVGYGHDQVNCDDCCEEDLCNANFSVQYYQEMMSRQYTSWFTPLPGE
ncbi:hypothetical protein TELCIR_12909, partial [Teladorsagia circumcincta]